MKTKAFRIDDKVRHVSDPHGRSKGVIVFFNHDRGLVRVRWSSKVQEWVTPDEIRLLEERQKV